MIAHARGHAGDGFDCHRRTTVDSIAVHRDASKFSHPYCAEED
jgi:hypothetical protein